MCCYVPFGLIIYYYIMESLIKRILALILYCIFLYPIQTIFVLFCFGYIPGIIASSKGYSLGKWFFYGMFLFPIAFIHSLYIKKTSNNNSNINNEDLKSF